MAGYRVAITGHLDVWRLPPSGSLPNEIVQVFNVNAESDAELSNFIDARVADIMGSGAMKVFRNPEIREIGKLQDWITVPLHMITHTSFTTKLLTGELPVYSRAEGKSIVPSGKDIKLQ